MPERDRITNPTRGGGLPGATTSPSKTSTTSLARRTGVSPWPPSPRGPGRAASGRGRAAGAAGNALWSSDPTRRTRGTGDTRARDRPPTGDHLSVSSHNDPTLVRLISFLIKFFSFFVCVRNPVCPFPDPLIPP